MKMNKYYTPINQNKIKFYKFDTFEHYCNLFIKKKKKPKLKIGNSSNTNKTEFYFDQCAKFDALLDKYFVRMNNPPDFSTENEMYKRVNEETDQYIRTNEKMLLCASKDVIYCIKKIMRIREKVDYYNTHFFSNSINIIVFIRSQINQFFESKPNVISNPNLIYTSINKSMDSSKHIANVSKIDDKFDYNYSKARFDVECSVDAIETFFEKEFRNSPIIQKAPQKIISLCKYIHKNLVGRFQQLGTEDISQTITAMSCIYDPDLLYIIPNIVDDFINNYLQDNAPNDYEELKNMSVQIMAQNFYKILHHIDQPTKIVISRTNDSASTSTSNQINIMNDSASISTSNQISIKNDSQSNNINDTAEITDKNKTKDDDDVTDKNKTNDDDEVTDKNKTNDDDEVTDKNKTNDDDEATDKNKTNDDDEVTDKNKTNDDDEVTDKSKTNDDDDVTPKNAENDNDNKDKGDKKINDDDSVSIEYVTEDSYSTEESKSDAKQNPVENRQDEIQKPESLPTKLSSKNVFRDINACKISFAPLRKFISKYCKIFHIKYSIYKEDEKKPKKKRPNNIRHELSLFPTRERMVLRCSFVRILCNIIYTNFPGFLYEPINPKFFQACEKVKLSTPKEMEINPKIICDHMMNSSFKYLVESDDLYVNNKSLESSSNSSSDQIFNISMKKRKRSLTFNTKNNKGIQKKENELKKASNLINETQFITNPIDIINNIHNALNLINEFFQKCGIVKKFGSLNYKASLDEKENLAHMQMNANFLAFDDIFPLFCMVISYASPSNAVAVSDFLVRTEDLKLGSQFEFAKLLFTSAVEYIINDVENDLLKIKSQANP